MYSEDLALKNQCRLYEYFMSLSITKILTKNIIRKTLCEGEEEEEEAESISSSLTPRSSMDTSLSIQDSIGGLQPRIQNILDISKVSHDDLEIIRPVADRETGFLDTGITDYITKILRKLIQLDLDYHHVGINKRKQK